LETNEIFKIAAECKINVNDKKSVGGWVISRYTEDSGLGTGVRIEGILFERMVARAIPAAAGGAGVVGDE